jgi:excisionase family DNA binding protein
MAGDILSVRETAEILQVTDKTVRRWLRDGIIPGKKLGSLWRINYGQLVESIRKAQEKA